LDSTDSELVPLNLLNHVPCGFGGLEV
jgi:hypothetical protein